jgi:hypothetical protein
MESNVDIVAWYALGLEIHGRVIRRVVFCRYEEFFF